MKEPSAESSCASCARTSTEAKCPEYELSGIENIVRGVCVVDGHVLLCRPKKGTYSYLPGGHIEFGETSREALVREMKEETGRDVVVGDFLGVVESQFDQHGKRHCEISLVYRMTFGACPHPAADGACPQRGRLQWGLSPSLPVVTAQEDWIEFAWCPLAKLSESNLLPQEMAKYVG